MQIIEPSTISSETGPHFDWHVTDGKKIRIPDGAKSIKIIGLSPGKWKYVFGNNNCNYNWHGFEIEKIMKVQGGRPYAHLKIIPGIDYIWAENNNIHYKFSSKEVNVFVQITTKSCLVSRSFTLYTDQLGLVGEPVPGTDMRKIHVIYDPITDSHSPIAPGIAEI